MLELTRPCRDIERLLLTTGKVEQEMTDRDRGLLLLSVGGMRAWAAGLRGQHKEVRTVLSQEVSN